MRHGATGHIRPWLRNFAFTPNGFVGDTQHKQSECLFTFRTLQLLVQHAVSLSLSRGCEAVKCTHSPLHASTFGVEIVLDDGGNKSCLINLIFDMGDTRPRGTRETKTSIKWHLRQCETSPSTACYHVPEGLHFQHYLASLCLSNHLSHSRMMLDGGPS